MRRIAVDLPVVAVAATIIAGLVLVAGTAMTPSTPPVALAYTPQPVLCTPSYCDPPDLSVGESGSPEPRMAATGTVAEAR